MAAGSSTGDEVRQLEVFTAISLLSDFLLEGGRFPIERLYFPVLVGKLEVMVADYSSSTAFFCSKSADVSQLTGSSR